MTEKQFVADLNLAAFTEIESISKRSIGRPFHGNRENPEEINQFLEESKILLKQEAERVAASIFDSDCVEIEMPEYNVWIIELKKPLSVCMKKPG